MAVTLGVDLYKVDVEQTVAGDVGRERKRPHIESRQIGGKR